MAGTPIESRDGAKPIEKFKSFEKHGDDCDYVLARSEFDLDGPLVTRRVLRVFERYGPILNLHVGRQVIGTTAEHPFYVQDKGWTAAHELRLAT